MAKTQAYKKGRRIEVLLLGALLSLTNVVCRRNQHGNLAAPVSGDLQYGEPTYVAFNLDVEYQCGSGRATDLGQAKLVRQPYLQHAVKGGIHVVWTSSEAAKVEVRDANKSADVLSILKGERSEEARGHAVPQWIAKADGLLPSSVYCYRLVGKLGAWSEWSGFKTAPAHKEPFKFSVIGDLGENTSDQRALFAQMKKVSSDFVLINGDVAYPDGALKSYEDYFFKVYQTMLGVVPFFPVAGNHDYNANGGETYRAVFSLPKNGAPEGIERWYSFEWGDLHVIALDTEAVGAQQTKWLENDLKQHADSPWTLVFMHKPPYSAGNHGDTKSVIEHFVPLFEQYQVDIVTAGHEHNYERLRLKNGTLYLVSGGGGRGTRKVKQAPNSALASSVIHFVHLSVSPSELTGWAIDGTGKVFDTFRLKRRVKKALKTADPV